MVDFVIYFNEHSLPSMDVGSKELQLWSNSAKLWVKGLKEVLKYQPEYHLGVSDGKFHDTVAGKPMNEWIKEWIGTDEYRRLLSKIQPIKQKDDLLREVRIFDKTAIGLTFAHFQKTWACSFPVDDSEWLVYLVKAKEMSVDGQGTLTESDCEIEHLSCIDHVEHWQQSLADWGKRVSQSSQVGKVDGYPILMYSAPSEHGVPHIHVVEGKSQNTIAKYRIDPFERMEGRRPDLDSVIRSWIGEHKESLLSSWKRCMSGYHPYIVT
jgi:hypothetical protein